MNILKHLWNFIDEQDWMADKKYRFALVAFGITFVLCGLVAWLIVQNWALSSWEWLFCFTGYPLVISWFVVFIFSCRHAFHDGEKSKQ